MSDPDDGPHPKSGDLSSYLDGDLTGRRAHHLEAHLASCDRCREELRTLRGAKAALSGLPPADPEPGWLPRVRDALAAPPARLARIDGPRGARWSRTARRGLRITGAAAGLAAAALWLGAWLAPPPETPVSFQDEVRQHMVQIDEPLADLTSYVVEARYP